MFSLFSLTLVLMNVTWILNDFHIKREKNDCCQKSGNTLLSPGEFLAGSPLCKLSNESLLYESDTILIELGKKNHAMKIPSSELALLLRELNLQVQYF